MLCMYICACLLIISSDEKRVHKCLRLKCNMMQFGKAKRINESNVIIRATHTYTDMHAHLIPANL